MKKMCILSVLVASLLFWVSCADDDNPGAPEDTMVCDGIGVGEYGCFNNSIHLCRYNPYGQDYWEARTDCSDQGDGCQCSIYQGMGICTTTGEYDSACR